MNEQAFDNCFYLTKVEIHTFASFLGSKSFFNYKSLKEITIPSSVTKKCIDLFN